MTETKFTPGPWEADIEDVGTLLHRAVIGPNGEFVADCDAHRLSGEETAANARLIAAAPAMFAFINEIAKFNPVFAKGFEKQRIKDAVALIAKATTV